MPPIYYNGIKAESVYYNSKQTTGYYNGVKVWPSNSNVFTLTLLNDGHGTLEADTITGYEGDTVTLTPKYNTYYRFSGYGVTGGTISNNTFTFGKSNATVQANFSANKFIVSGQFASFGSSKYLTEVTATTNTGVSYAKAPSLVTGTIPAAWTATKRTSVLTATINGKTRPTSGSNYQWYPQAVGGVAISGYYCSGAINRTGTHNENKSRTVKFGAYVRNNTTTIASKTASRTTSGASTTNFTWTTTTPGLLNCLLSGSINAAAYWSSVTAFNGTWSASGYIP